MPIISRKTQKIFAQNATNNGQFGSAQLGTKVLSSDLATLQSLTAFTSGWNSATMSAKKLPTLEEMQALHYITTSQIAYLFQEGIAEYDSGTEYRINSLVKKSGTTEIYKSLINANTGNALTDNTKWALCGDLSNLSKITSATSTAQGIAFLPLPVDPITAGNNSTTPNTDVDFFAGTMTFNDNLGQAKATAMTKRLQSSGSWSAGNNGNGLLSGARANSSTYHWFALYKASDNSVDYGCILGVAGTTPDPTSVLPSGYSKYQYIFSVLTDGSGNIRRGSYSFRLDGSYTCEYNTYIENRALSAAPTSPTLLTLTVPLGLKVISKTFVYFEYASRAYFLLIDPAKTTALSTGGHFNFSGYQSYASNANNATIETLTDTSGRVSIVANLANNAQVITTGFIYNPINR